MDGSYNTQGYDANMGQCSSVLRMRKVDPRTGKNSKVIANYRGNRGERYGRDQDGPAGQIEVDGMGQMLCDVYDEGLENDIVTKDLNTPAAEKLCDVNKTMGTNTKKGNDFNHTIKAAIGIGLRSKKQR